MKRFILIALACILPNLNNAFAATKVPPSALEDAIQPWCCGHNYNKVFDKSKVAHYDEKQGKLVAGPSKESADFNQELDGYYKSTFNDSVANVRKLIKNGANVHAPANIENQSFYLLRTGTLIDMVDNMIDNYDTCSDKKQTRDGFTMASLSTSKYCREIRQMLIDAWPNEKNGGDGQTKYVKGANPSHDYGEKSSAPESKPAETIVQKIEVQPTPPAPEVKTESSAPQQKSADNIKSAEEAKTDIQKKQDETTTTKQTEEQPNDDIVVGELQEDNASLTKIPNQSSTHVDAPKNDVTIPKDCNKTQLRGVHAVAGYVKGKKCIPTKCDAKKYKKVGTGDDAKCVEICDKDTVKQLKKNSHVSKVQVQGEQCVPALCDKGYGNEHREPVDGKCEKFQGEQIQSDLPAETEGDVIVSELEEEYDDEVIVDETPIPAAQSQNRATTAANVPDADGTTKTSKTEDEQVADFLAYQKYIQEKQGKTKDNTTNEENDDEDDEGEYVVAEQFRSKKTAPDEAVDETTGSTVATEDDTNLIFAPGAGPTIFERLDIELKNKFTDTKSSVWKNAEGKFNTARLASDSIAATVLGTVSGVVTSTVMKKAQVKQGFEDMRCTIAGQNIASYGDEFKVGLVPMP